MFLWVVFGVVGGGVGCWVALKVRAWEVSSLAGEAAQLDNFCAMAFAVVAVDRGLPSRAGCLFDEFTVGPSIGKPTENPMLRPCSSARNAFVAPAESARTRIGWITVAGVVAVIVAGPIGGG